MMPRREGDGEAAKVPRFEEVTEAQERAGILIEEVGQQLALRQGVGNVQASDSTAKQPKRAEDALAEVGDAEDVGQIYELGSTLNRSR